MRRDLPQALQLLQEMKEHVKQVTGVVDKMLERVKKGEVSTAKVNSLSMPLSCFNT